MMQAYHLAFLEALSVSRRSIYLREVYEYGRQSSSRVAVLEKTHRRGRRCHMALGVAKHHGQRKLLWPSRPRLGLDTIKVGYTNVGTTLGAGAGSLNKRKAFAGAKAFVP